MLRTVSECRDFRRRLESKQKEAGSNPVAKRRIYNRIMQEVTDLSRAGQVDWSVLTLFEEMVDNGSNIVREMRANQGHSGVIMEAGGPDAINTGNFSNIIGQISFGTALDAMENPSFIGDQLVRVVPATTAQREMVPGVTKIGDQAQKIGENEEYPYVQVGEEYVTLPELDKQGFMIAVTEEIIMEDKTSLLQQRFAQASEALGITREKDRLNVALGITTSYSRNGGPQQATYANTHTQGNFDNLVASNGLVDYTDIDAALAAFAGMTDPDTGEPVIVPPNLQLVHPWELRSTVNNVLYPEFIRQGAIAAAVPLMQAQNPLTRPGREAVSPVMNQYVSVVTSSTSTWFLGDFKEAFVEREQIPLQLIVEDRGSGVAFERDIVFRQKVRYKSKTGVLDPWKVVKCTA